MATDRALSRPADWQAKLLFAGSFLFRREKRKGQ
jgi:hypothetical protein